MITKVNLSNWKTQKEILVELNREWGLNVSSRTWRMAVERWNMKFAENEVPYYITHSNIMGYKATTDYKEARIARNDYLKRAFNMLRKAHDCDIAFQHKKNYMFDFEAGEVK